MNLRLKDLADTVAEILANRWLEQEQRRADQSPNRNADLPSPTGTGMRKPAVKDTKERTHDG